MKLFSVQKIKNFHPIKGYCVIETCLDENKSRIVFSGSITDCSSFISLSHLMTDKFSEEELLKMYKFGESINR
jgi:hypothetical protein